MLLQPQTGDNHFRFPMITKPGFGIYLNDDYPASPWTVTPEPKSIFTGMSEVLLDKYNLPEPASNDAIYLFGPSISCPVQHLNGAAVLRCPRDGQRCLFFHPAHLDQPAWMANPKNWAFLLDHIHGKKWVHPGPACLGNYSNLCNGLRPTCSQFQGVKRNAAEQGFKPFGCKAYQTCWNSWRMVKEFPACVQAVFPERGEDRWTAPPT